MIVKLSPPLKDYIWAGGNLAKYWNKRGCNIAESWELSFVEGSQSVVDSGEFCGKKLSEVTSRADWGKNCDRFDRFPLLVKLIDAGSDLSVQVHPDDDYALAHEGQLGKTEMWYILDAAEGAGLYLGLNATLTAEQFRQSVAEGSITSRLNFLPVKAGETYFVPAGTLHAIGKGVTLLEIQQNSTLTYRVYDYGRRDKEGNLRPLHVEKAAATASLQKYVVPDARRKSFLGGCKYFSAYRYRRGKRFLLHSFASVTVTKGAFAVGDVPLERGETAFVSAEQPFCVKGSGEYVLVCVE